MNRKRLDFSDQSRILDFIFKMDNEEDDYVLEDNKGWLRVNARSINGALYAAKDFNEVYIANATHQGVFPNFIKEFEV